MKTILLPFSGSDTATAALDTALVVARDFDSYIEGLFVRQLPPIIAGEGITLPGDYMTQLAEESQAQAKFAKEKFEKAMGERGIASGNVVTKGVSAGWCEIEGTLTQAIGEYGRVFDLIMVARDEQRTIDWKAACETALFESGRPVMVAGASAPQTIGANILVAWNGSTETSRTVAMAMPFLVRAKTVKVLSVEGSNVSGPDVEHAANQIGRHGINVSAESIDPQGVAPGQAILDYAQKMNADLIVKGAYTHSRLRQMIFGGATSELLNNSTVPVLFCH
ncbi:MAG: universal stress protein [Gammaproteobacteria bacterium]|nr:universal stress protein [Gammaproteobacteria bacterium]